MKLFGPVYDRVLVWSAHPRAPWYLGGLSVAESSFFPIPPDVMLAPMVLARPPYWWRFALLTTVASVVGGLIGYAIGYFAIDAVIPLLHRLGWYDHFVYASELYVEWGVWIVLLAGFSPIPYKVFTIASGAAGMAVLPFVAASLVGRAARFFLVAALVRAIGPRIEPTLRKYIDTIGWITVVVAVVAWFVLRG
ncbi:MAG: YqaA family protein [Gammaproteobacteria bacterium]